MIRIGNISLKVESLANSQLVINLNDYKTMVFQSYDKVIAVKVDGAFYLDENYWDYSKTTGKYRNQFLGETKKETEVKIKSGEYILTNLN